MRTPFLICSTAFFLMSFGGIATAAEVRSEAGTLIETRREVPFLRQDISRGTIQIAGRTLPPDQATISRIVDRYGSLPGGIVLEGTGTGLEGVTSVRYDASSGGLLLGQNLTFIPQMPMIDIAELARSLAEDDRIGVSITDDSVVVYGATPEETQLARNLSVSDVFLADFVMPPQEWTKGYVTAPGFQSDLKEVDQGVVAFYLFHDFSFAIADGTVSQRGAAIDLYVVPVLEKTASDGGYMADMDAISSNSESIAVSKNAEHVSHNMDYYFRERAAHRALVYGGVAALLRHLKTQGADLNKLADEIEEVEGEAAPDEWASLKDAWKAYLLEIQTAGDFANWSAAPYDLFLKGHEINHKEAAVK